VVDQVDGDATGAGDAPEGLGHGVDGHVVVFAHAMRRDERVDDERVEAAALERRDERGFDRLRDERPRPGQVGDDDLDLAASVGEKPPLDLMRLNAVVDEDCVDAALGLVLWILAVPVPDPERLDRLNANKVAARRHGNGVGDRQRALAHARGRDGGAEVLPAIVRPIDEGSPWDGFRVSPHEGGRVEDRRRRVVGSWRWRFRPSATDGLVDQPVEPVFFGRRRGAIPLMVAPSPCEIVLVVAHGVLSVIARSA
jgi:hypothetical protein